MIYKRLRSTDAAGVNMSFGDFALMAASICDPARGPHYCLIGDTVFPYFDWCDIERPARISCDDTWQHLLS